MDVIAYYEGSNALRDWLTSLLEIPITFKKLPAQNSSPEFTKLPAYVADILYLDKPDLVLSGCIDGIHEKPIFSVEFAACTPQYQHALQRFPRMLASVNRGAPAILILPHRKKENIGGERQYVRSQAIEYAASRLMDVYDIPAFVFDWPDSEGILEYEHGTSLPKHDSESIRELKELLRGALAAFNGADYISNLWKISSVRALLEKARAKAYRGSQPTIERPGGGSGAATGPNLRLMATSDLIAEIRSRIPRVSAILNQLPDFIRNREQSLVFYPTRVIEHAGDPYVGMMAYYDIAFCRHGQSTRDRFYNLVSFCNGVSIREFERTMKDFNEQACPFTEPITPSNVLSYSYHLKHGCRETKSKPVRIYSELADMIIFTDGMLLNVG